MAKNKNNNHGKKAAIDWVQVRKDLKAKNKWWTDSRIDEEVARLKKEDEKKNNPNRSDAKKEANRPTSKLPDKYAGMDYVGLSASGDAGKNGTNDTQNVGWSPKAVAASVAPTHVSVAKAKHGNDFDKTLKLHAGTSNTHKRAAKRSAASIKRRQEQKNHRAKLSSRPTYDLIEYIKKAYGFSANGSELATLREYSVVVVGESVFSGLFSHHSSSTTNWKYNKSYSVNDHSSHREYYTGDGLFGKFSRLYPDTTDKMEYDVSDFNNEVVLYHGPPPQNMGSLLSTPFKSGNGGLFGAGIYLTPDIAKTWSYNGDRWGSPIDDRSGRRFILEVKALLGPIHNTASAGNYSCNLDYLWSRGYTSIYAGPDNMGFTFSEYCVYDSKQVKLIAIHEFIRKGGIDREGEVK